MVVSRNNKHFSLVVVKMMQMKRIIYQHPLRFAFSDKIIQQSPCALAHRNMYDDIWHWCIVYIYNGYTRLKWSMTNRLLTIYQIKFIII